MEVRCGHPRFPFMSATRLSPEAEAPGGEAIIMDIWMSEEYLTKEWNISIIVREDDEEPGSGTKRILQRRNWAIRSEDAPASPQIYD